MARVGRYYGLDVKSDYFIHQIVTACNRESMRQKGIDAVVATAKRHLGDEPYDVVTVLECLQYDSVFRAKKLYDERGVVLEDNCYGVTDKTSQSHPIITGGWQILEGAVLVPHTCASRQVAVENISRHGVGIAALICKLILPERLDDAAQEVQLFLAQYEFDRRTLYDRLVDPEGDINDELLQEALGIRNRDNYFKIFPQARGDYRNLDRKELARLRL